MTTTFVRRVGAALLLVAAVSACGDSDRADGDAQPAPDVSVFRGGSFDQLPRYPRSDELGSLTERGDIRSQSFAVVNASPRKVLEYYERNLNDWVVVQPVIPVGPDAFRGIWARDGRHLMISASRSPTVEADNPETPTLQYNLQLGPAGSFPES